MFRFKSSYYGFPRVQHGRRVEIIKIFKSSSSVGNTDDTTHSLHVIVYLQGKVCMLGDGYSANISVSVFIFMP